MVKGTSRNFDQCVEIIWKDISKSSQENTIIIIIIIYIYTYTLIYIYIYVCIYIYSNERSPYLIPVLRVAEVGELFLRAPGGSVLTE